jgi:hypothetical protein
VEVELFEPLTVIGDSGIIDPATDSGAIQKNWVLVTKDLDPSGG